MDARAIEAGVEDSLFHEELILLDELAVQAINLLQVKHFFRLSFFSVTLDDLEVDNCGALIHLDHLDISGVNT